MRRGIAAACVVLLLTGCETTDDDPALAAASEAAKARQVVPTTVPSTTPPAKVTAPPQPAELTKNPIYRVGKLTAHCPEPKYEPTTVANIRAYYVESVRCLNAAWAPAIRKAGFEFTAPKLDVVAGRSPDLPCDGDAYGLYCGGTIYINAQVDLDDFRDDPVPAKGWMAFVIGHEYGHHVQALTGMAEVRYRRGLKLNGVEVALEESRRAELQADCFAGVYYGANRAFTRAAAWPMFFEHMAESTSDPDYDHGSAKNQGSWSHRGFTTADPAVCNTYVASSDQVS